MNRVFGASDAKGGCEIVPSKTAVCFIEYQNEFTTEGGKLHESVKLVMEETGMLAKSVELADCVRAAGGCVIHVPINFEEDASDNPNKGSGILGGCANGKLFTVGTWNAEFCEAMRPHDGDFIVSGKKGLDAFPGTNLEELLVKSGIETVAICGFLTDCCVEGTLRTAYEKGFNTISVTDCCATSSKEGHDASTKISFNFFSTPMTFLDLKGKLTK
eukprot:TRINITY_DN8479_c0_g1_i1.p1 TRINITY_DN8479_c0_g1~~TRINITY_DN8479_c0_g1_i1.p1  ORF type:complete len:216 (-),score=43.19 TRINITY_DN8479_c0_g1_i1:142-789(-)